MTAKSDRRGLRKEQLSAFGTGDMIEEGAAALVTPAVGVMSQTSIQLLLIALIVGDAVNCDIKLQLSNDKATWFDADQLVLNDLGYYEPVNYPIRLATDTSSKAYPSYLAECAQFARFYFQFNDRTGASVECIVNGGL